MPNIKLRESDKNKIRDLFADAMANYDGDNPKKYAVTVRKALADEYTVTPRVATAMEAEMRFEL